MYNQQSKKHDRFKKEVASVMNKTIVMDGATRMNYSRCVHILMWMIVNIFDGLSSFPSSSFLLGMVAFALGLLDLICLTKNMNNVCIVCFRQVVYALDYFVEKIKLYDCSQWCRRNVSLSCKCRRNIVRCNILRDSCRTNVAAIGVSGLDQEIEVGSIAAWKNLQKRRARGNLPQHITNAFDPTNDRALSVNGFIKIDEVKNDGCISPLSYLLLFINFLMANITSEMLNGGFERCFGATQTSPTEKRGCKEVGVVFLDFFLFCGDFLLTSNFFKTFGILLLGGNI